MQNLKRVLSLVLVVAMVASFMLSAVAAPAEQLADLADSKYQSEVRVLNALGIVEGYEDGTYKPANEVTRAELALILARVRVGGDKDMIRTYNYGHMTYTDILNAGYQWAASGIQYCTDNGMVVGDGNGKYRPGDTVTIVEALKMLLTALGYDAELEGLQNVGAAWKANTLALAREVGLMDRVYGDTNRNCTRDDIALLIYNFLNSLVVKGYYENTVANVDTTLYKGGTALAVYFGKQIVYGAIVANEKAILEDVSKSTNIANPTADRDEQRLQAGYTELFLYEKADENKVALADLVNTRTRRGNAASDYFMTVKGLSTDLGDIGESVFVITDLNPTKGYYEAVGGVCFLSGENAIGVETWKDTSAIALASLVTADTLYYDDYDAATAAVLGGGNGNFLKTVDFNGDGKLDLVLTEDWTMTFAYGANRAGVVTTSGNNAWALLDRDADCAIFGYVNFHEADGIIYSVAADVVAKTALAAGTDAINYAKQYITLADGNKYEQSAIGYTGLAPYTVIMNCVDDPVATQNYNWYLDCGGYIRAYGEDYSQYSLYLLTDASSKLNGRVYNKNITVYQKSNEAANYGIVDYDDEFVRSGDGIVDLPYDAQISFPGAVTNLVSGAAADTMMALEDPFTAQKLTLVNLTATNKATQYTADGGVTTYATTLTDYYIVTLGWDRVHGKSFVAGVEYIQGYANAKFNTTNATIYAAVSNGVGYYEANTIVVESFDPTSTAVPVFAYQHISASYDNWRGLFAIIDNTGSLDATMYVSESDDAFPIRTEAEKGGFYLYNAKNAAATLIENNFAANGIYADTVRANLSNRDYVVLASGKQIKIADVPIYALTSTSPLPNGDWAISEYTGLKAGEKIIYVTNVLGALQYILVVDDEVNGVSDPLFLKAWNTDAIALWGYIVAGTYPVYEPTLAELVTAFDAATAAWLNNENATTYAAMVDAYLAAYALTEDKVQDPDESLNTYKGTNRSYKAGQIAAKSAVINKTVDANKTYFNAFVDNGESVAKWNTFIGKSYETDGKIDLDNIMYPVAEGAYRVITEADLAILAYQGIDTSAYDKFPAQAVVAAAQAAAQAIETRYDAYLTAADNAKKADLVNELQLLWDAWKANFLDDYCSSKLDAIAKGGIPELVLGLSAS